MVAVNGNGSYNSSSPVFLNELGVWRFTVAYSGDARNEPSLTGCDDYPTTVTVRTPVFLQLSRPSSLVVGGFATVFGQVVLFQPSQPLSLRVFAPSDPTCAGSPAISRQVPAPAFTETVGPLDAVGTWRFVLSYPGDAFNTAGASACNAFPLEVTTATASLGPYVSPSSVTVGQPVSAGASVFGQAATGTLTVRLFSPTDPLCSSAVAVETVQVGGSGPVTASLVPTSVGAWRVTSEYSGDANNTPATTSCGSIVFGAQKATPVLSVTAVPGLAEDGDRVHARVDLGSAYQPTGRVSFGLFAPSDATCTEVPAYVEEVSLSGTSAETSVGFEVPKHEVGRWNWTATYLGDENNELNGSGCGTAPVEVVKKIKKDK